MTMYMGRVVVAAVVLGVGSFCADARSQVDSWAVGEPAATSSPPPATTVAPARAPATSAAPAQRTAPVSQASFDAEAERYVRLKAFTDRLQTERDGKAFERSMRLAEFNRRLQAAREEESRREFDERLSIYLRKCAFTRALIERRRGSPERDAP